MISDKIQKTLRNIQQRRRISNRFAFYSLGGNLCESLGSEKWAASCRAQADKRLMQYLENAMEPLFEKYSHMECPQGSYAPDAPIWVCWWQGEEAAPPVVKRCIHSIRENAGSHPVNVLSKDTCQDFLDIPDFLLTKADQGLIGLAHLCDYIRLALIAKWGGLWIDSTILVTGQLPESYFDIPFFSCKTQERQEEFVSKGMWTGFLLGGWKESIVFCYLRDALALYWANHDFAAAYHFFDHLILLGYLRLPAMKQAIDGVPANNVHLYSLSRAMQQGLAAEQLDDFLHEDTLIYKLSWRNEFPEKTPDGKDTAYAAFLKLPE